MTYCHCYYYCYLLAHEAQTRMEVDAVVAVEARVCVAEAEVSARGQQVMQRRLAPAMHKHRTQHKISYHIIW